MRPLPPELDGSPVDAPADIKRLMWGEAKHIILPGHTIRTAKVKRRETIARFLQRVGWKFNLPTVCVVNGEFILRKNRGWKRYRLKAGDDIVFQSRPWFGRHGGGGASTTKAVAGLVALVALTAIAPWAAQWAWFGIGMTGLAPQWLSVGLVLGGAFLINSLIAPKPASTDSDQPDQVYSIAASGNTGRPFDPITVSYGRVKSFPDFANAAWSEYVGNEQYLNVLLAVGCGKHQYHQLLLDDTPYWDSVTGLDPAFTGVQVAFYDPGEQVTLFPINIAQSAEVSGQELPEPDAIHGDGWIGGFIANNAGTIANAIALDFVCPSGLFSTDDQGGMGITTVSLEAQARLVDDAGEPLGAFADILVEDVQNSTKTPLRFTRKIALADGRWEVRVRRTNHVSTDISITNNVNWQGLRAYIKGPTSFPGVSTVAIRIQANAQLGQGTARRFGVDRTRILPVWNGAEFVEQPTQNPFWAFYDAATNTDYGARRPVAKIDFQNIVDGAAAADARGDQFNYEFKSAVVVPEAFDTILKVARSRHRWAGDILTTVRDEWRPIPDMLLTDREIVRGTLSIDYIANQEDSADCVIMEYVDSVTNKQAEVQYPPNVVGGFQATNPARLRLEGLTDRAHAYRECAFQYLQNFYRRRMVKLQTEYDGRRLQYGSSVRVQSELPQEWGSAGAITNRDALALTLDPAPDWSAVGQYYLVVRDKTGRQWGPVKVNKGASDDIALIDPTDLATVEAAGQTLDEALARADGADEPTFSHGLADKWAMPCTVVSGEPQGNKVNLTLFVDDINVHADDLGIVPVLPSTPPLFNPKVPQLTGLYAAFEQGIAEPKLHASWTPAPGAFLYIAQVSYDGGINWGGLWSGSETEFDKVVEYADLKLRVRPIGLNVGGAWISLDVAAPTISIKEASLEAQIQSKLLAAEQTVQSYNNPTAVIENMTGVPIGQLLEDLGQSVADIHSQMHLLVHTMRGAGADFDPVNTTFRLWALDTYKDQVTSSFNSEILTRATEDAALAQRSDTLEASVFDPATGLPSRAAASDVITLQSLVNDPINGNLALAASTSTLSASVFDPVTGLPSRAAASDVTTLIALTGDATHGNIAIATRTSTLEAHVGSYSASATIGTVVTNLYAAYSITLDVNGHLGGLLLNNDGSHVTLTIDGNVLVNGSVTASKLDVINLAAVSANFGSATFSGTASSRSTGARLVLDFSGNNISVYDA